MTAELGETGTATSRPAQRAVGGRIRRVSWPRWRASQEALHRATTVSAFGCLPPHLSAETDDGPVFRVIGALDNATTGFVRCHVPAEDPAVIDIVRAHEVADWLRILSEQPGVSSVTDMGERRLRINFSTVSLSDTVEDLNLLLRADWLLDHPTASRESPEAHIASLENADNGLSRSEALKDFGCYDYPDWDADGAERITAEVLDCARQLLDSLPDYVPAPHAAPGADGSIGMEWWNGERRAFVDIGPGDRVLTYLNTGDGEPRERHFQRDDPELGRYLERLFQTLLSGVDVSGGRE